MIKKYLTSTAIFWLLASQIDAQTLSPNGYSGIGFTPIASTIGRGTLVVAHDSTVPGATVNNGYNTQVGVGLTDDLELVGRLATNNQKCNMFKEGACPPNTYRDFSASMKYSLPIDWLKKNKVAMAIGATDFGGAATYFRSYYVVGTKSFESVDFSLGQAVKSKSGNSVLDGTFASAAWHPVNWLSIGIQKVGQNSSAHASLVAPISTDGSTAWLTFNRRISDLPVTEKNWVGWGVSLPLDRVGNHVAGGASVEPQSLPTKFKEISKKRPSDLAATLLANGFYNPKIGHKADGSLHVVLENTSYSWNILDAAGVALGAISSSYADEKDGQEFELVLTTRGIGQLRVIGEAKCVGEWLSNGGPCRKLVVSSLGQSSADRQTMSNSLQQLLGMPDGYIDWTSGAAWNFRPEIIVSPSLVSTIGTEYGSFDADLGANVNFVVPLWAGATIESNRVEPLGVGTKQFEQGGAFFASRLKPVTNRTLLHQLISLPAINTQARISTGTAYTTWSGHQVETSTQSENGRHKLGLTEGSFKNDGPPTNNERSYHLVSYRYANNDQQTSVTEITQGKFWAGDRGFSINQRFWYGDTSWSINFRRSRMSESQPLVSFAGVQFAIPLTPRENKGLEYVGLRGVSQWTYALETKVLEKDNKLTGGYGEVPRVGDSLVMTFNRDRNSTRYYETNMGRMRNAYLNLGENGVN